MTRKSSISGHTEQSRGFKIYDNFNNMSHSRKAIYENNNDTGSAFDIIFQPPIVLQFIEITDTDPITICELKVIESGKW